MSLMSLQDCGHGTYYTTGPEVSAPPFDTTPFRHVHVTCNICGQMEILPDLLTPEEVEEYEDWTFRMIDLEMRVYEDPQY